MDNISEVTAGIIAVPYSLTDFYFYNEILSEGNHKKDVSFIPLLNKEGLPSTSEYHDVVLSFMKELREHHDAQYPIDLDGMKIDVGLIDIQVFFSGEKQLILNTMKQKPNMFFEENLKKVEAITNNQIHDQMMMGSCIHFFSPSGEFSFHYHNIIFGLRIEDNIYTDINFQNIMSAISDNGYNIAFASSNQTVNKNIKKPSERSTFREKIMSLIRG